MRKVRFALAPFVIWRALGVALGAAVVQLVVRVLVAHLGEPRYLVAAGALAVFAAALTALSTASLVSGVKLDYGGAVTAIQRDIERPQLVAAPAAPPLAPGSQHERHHEDAARRGRGESQPADIARFCRDMLRHVFRPLCTSTTLSSGRLRRSRLRQ